MKSSYDHQTIEKKWQERWDKEKLYEADVNQADNKFYCLDMFPYPSGDGLHVGHWRGYVLSDFYARYWRLKGKNVLHPMGFDAFGLPAENAAIKNNSHPKEFTDKAVKTFTRQLKEIGSSFDWSKVVNTSDPEYYKWTQWLFLQFFNHGLAEKRKSLVNWCPKDQTVLANEQVVDGKCERCGTTVEKKELAQWYLKITDFAQELLDGLDDLNWPENVKQLQRNWIGRSVGATVVFKTEKSEIEVFTTRPDTIFGVNAIVLAPEHGAVKDLVTSDQKTAVEKYLKDVASKTNVARQQESETEKSAVFTGAYAIHPLTDEKLPIWLADYVLLTYGTGAVMSVPAHDERDYLFAETHKLPIKVVVEPITGEPKESEEHRRSIVAVVHDPKKDKYLSINWGKQLGGNLFVGGGVEDGEDLAKAASREIAEETGYRNLKLVCQSENIHHHYFAHSKNRQRYILATGFLFELIDESKQGLRHEEDEKGKFKAEWLTANQVRQNVFDPLHLYVYERLAEKHIFSGKGILTDSGEYSGLASDEGAKKIVTALEQKKAGKPTTTYRLRDWLVSRQRYWGAPIPIIYDPTGKPHPIEENHLPLLLPIDVDFQPGGESPIARSKEYTQQAEKTFGKGWHFETDTLDTFVDSSWYFFRYLSPTDKTQAFNKELVDSWLPVDLYVGGIEHAILHLLYARFISHFLARHDYIQSDIQEPFKQLFNIGMVTLHGAKMSKSKGNVVNPDEIIEHYGTDALRGYELFMGPMAQEVEWSGRGINGIHRFLIKLWQFANEVEITSDNHPEHEKAFTEYLEKLNVMIKDFRLNTAISEAMKLLTTLEKSKHTSKKVLEDFIITLSPIFPFLCDELWQKMGHRTSVSHATWPEATAVATVVKVKVLINQKFAGELTFPRVPDQEDALEKAREDIKIAAKLNGLPIKKSFYQTGRVLNIISD